MRDLSSAVVIRARCAQRRPMTSAGRVVEFARGVDAASRFAWTYTFTIPE
jgi:hypothetical protein